MVPTAKETKPCQQRNAHPVYRGGRIENALAERIREACAVFGWIAGGMHPSTGSIGARAGLLGDADILWLSEESQCLFATFTADAALFHSAKRDSQIPHQPAIYPDCAGVNSFGDAMGAIEILCPDT